MCTRLYVNVRFFPLMLVLVYNSEVHSYSGRKTGGHKIVGYTLEDIVLVLYVCV